MPPLPSADMPHHGSSKPAETADAGIDLSKLRRGWSKQFDEISAIPVAAESNVTETQSSSIEDLPELPTLGAVASKAAMALDDLDEMLSRYHQQDSQSPAPAVDTPYSPSASKVPEMPTSAIPTATNTPGNLASGKLEDIPAFPIPPTEEVSMPLARDALLQSLADTEARPKLDDLRKTAPQFSKFCPEAEQEKTSEPEQEKPPVSVEQEDIPEFTDEDLREALQPIVDPVVDQFLYTPSKGIHTYLEPMLRSTVRRAIAEQMLDATPFQNISGWDKFTWKLRAMFSSRTYDDIVFDYTRRYQVEEVYLLRPHSRSLISYASHDPARHARPDKVEATVKRIASKESEHKTEDNPWIKWRDTRNLMIRRGEHCILAAIVHGPSNAILRADLEYALRQAEDRFGRALEDESDIHMQILQPLLEGCLLIQAPAIPN